MVEQAERFYPPAVINACEPAHHMPSTVDDRWFHPQGHQRARPVTAQRGKGKAKMHGGDNCYELIEIVPGEPLMRPPGAFRCKLGPCI